jgi:formylglycine-generating enzyme required for sulfatase activity
MRAHATRFSRYLPLVAALGWAPAASAVTIDWTPVGDPGNACETQFSDGCFGAVGYRYNIGTYEVTNAQYAEFLNAVAAAGQSDPNALYNAADMGSGSGGITRTAVGPDYHYAAIPSREDMPVDYVSFYDALRFANWLHNGQPTGTQDSTTTEDGAYTITAQGISDNSITRNAGATIFLTSEDEWYKAAYYHALSASYFDYPAGSDTDTTCAAPTAATNSANCDGAAGGLTNKGSYPGSASPYGTFDQGGNLYEWNEAVISGSDRGVRGGSFLFDEFTLAAWSRASGSPAGEGGIGFRIASVPEPGTGLLVMTALLGLALLPKRRTS